MPRLVNRPTDRPERPRTARRRGAARRPTFLPNFDVMEVRITPVVKTWSGAVDNLWTDAANWDNNAAPQPGDDLVFPAGASRLTATNDFTAGTSFGSVTIQGAGYTLLGNAVSLTGGLTTSYTSGASEDQLDTASATGAVSVAPGGELDLSGVLSGSSGLTVSGGGTLALTAANTFDGAVTVSQGVVTVSDGSALGTGSVGTTVDAGAEIDLSGGIALTTGPLSLDGSGVAGAGAVRSTGGTNSIAAAVSLGSDVTVGVDAGQLTLGGVIDDGGDGFGLTKVGAGTLVLSGLNTYNGNTLVNSGTVLADGAVNGVNVAAGATLGGTGTAGAVTVNGGTVHPGDGGPGVLTAGSLALDAASTLAVDLDGNTLGAYGRVDVGGAVNLGGATLSATLGGSYHPGAGDALDLIHNTGGGAIANGFTGLPEGSLIALGASTFRLTYTGGGGNDAVLNFVQATTTSLSPSANPATYGQSVTFTATVSSASGTPTGTVTFMDGATVLGTGTLNGSGVATLTTKLSGGSHTVTAVYGGDPGSLASTSPSVAETVSQASVSGGFFQLSINPAEYGQVLVFRVVAFPTAGGADPTGTVTFSEGATVLGTGTLDTSSPAGSQVYLFYSVPTYTALPVGGHTITASYGGDNNYQSFTPPSQTQTITQAGTTTFVSSDTDPTVYGQPVTFTASVSPDFAGVPTGTVTFFDGATLLGAATLDGTGTATFTTSALAVGGHSVTAVYGGDPNFTGSTSSSSDQTIDQAGTSTVVTPSVNPSVWSQPVTLTAVVSASAPSSGVPTGTVTFFDGATLLGTATLDGTGTATFTTSALAVGSHAVTAVYGGDPNFTGSTSPVASDEVDQAATSTSLSPSADPSVYGQSVTFTAVVSASAPGSGTPTGTVTFMDGATVLGTRTLDGAGTATFTTSAFAGGSHTVTAVYGGDPGSLASTSPSVTETVSQASVSGGFFQLSINPAEYGQVLVFRVVAFPTAGGADPTGTVTFSEGATVLGTGTLDTSSPAGSQVYYFYTVPPNPALPAGSHTITASYGGDNNYQSFTPPSQTQTITQAGTTTFVSSDTDPTVYGQPVTFTASVSPDFAGVPTGAVTFFDGATLLGTGTLDGTGTATFTTSALAVGSHAVTAVYGGDANFTGSTSSSSDQTVDQADTSTVVTPSADPSAFGQATTFTAVVSAVAPGAGVPTGLVTFFDGATLLGTVSLDGTGTATFTTSALGVGSHPVMAVYGGDTDFTGSTSPVASDEVDQAATSTSLSSSADPSVFGQSTTFTAVVSAVAPGGGVPTGAVTFFDGATLLGAAAVDGTGTATFTTSALAVGSHAVTAVYGGDANFTGSTSPVSSQAVGQADTSTVVTPSADPSAFGQATTFTAVVSAVAPGAGVPTGLVTFFDGATLLGTVSLDGTGTATFTTSALGVGSHPVTAVYGGDTDFLSSASAVASQVVQQAGTTAAVVASADPSVFGQPITFTAVVSAIAPGAGTPSGTVTFMDGSTALGTVTLDGTGTASVSTSGLAPGSHSITAVYNGDGDFLASTSAAPVQVVNQADTTTGLTASANPSVWGQPVTFTATVSASAPGAGVPSGVVTFFDGATALGIGTLDGTGTATFTTSGLALGGHSVTAVYGGDADFLSSTSAGASQAVNQAGTTTAVSASANPVVLGHSVTFTAVVSASAPGAGVPTGIVTFMDGATLLGTGTLDGTGTATFTTSGLALGGHTVTAVYGGDADFLTGTSPAVNEMVGQAPTTASVSSSANPSVWGQSATFTATVSAASPGAGTPTGSVTFLDGTTVLGTAVLDASGQATFTTSALAVGSHAVSVSYQGDLEFLGSVSAPALSQAVNPDATGTAVAASVNPSVWGQPVTFTATVSAVAPGVGTPTGSVTFYDGATPLGTVGLDGAGQAALGIPSLFVGGHLIFAVYNGGPNDLPSTSAAVLEGVNRSDTTETLTSSAAPSVFGQPLTFHAAVTAVAPGAGVPAGSVQLLDGTTVIATAALDASGGADFAVTSLGVGSHSLTVSYLGDPSFKPGASPALAQSVGQDTTSVNLAPVSPSVFGQPVTFTATVTADAPGAGAPTGTVAFFDGSTPLGTVALDGAGMATFTTSALAVGGHAIQAVYGGSAGLAGSTSAASNLSVSQDATTVTVASSAGSTVFGQPLTFTATVAATAPGAGAPTGTVAFMSGTTVLGTAALNASGTATFTTASLAPGSYPVTAVYPGDGSFLANASAAQAQAVQRDTTAVLLVSSSGSTAYGQPVTFAAGVFVATPGTAALTGTVTFRDGATVLGTVHLSSPNLAVLTTRALGAGTHAITAVYNGDTDTANSSSATLVQAVAQRATAEVLYQSTNVAGNGQPVVFAATVAPAPPGAAAPSGVVAFIDGAAVLGWGYVVNGMAAIIAPMTPAGSTHKVTAIYFGDANYLPGASESVFVHVVQGLAPVALSAAPTSGRPGQIHGARLVGVPAGGSTTSSGSVTPSVVRTPTVTFGRGAFRAATRPTSAFTPRPHALVWGTGRHR